MDKDKQTVGIFKKILLVYIAVLIVELFLFVTSLSVATSGVAKKVTNLRIKDFIHNLLLLEKENLDDEELNQLSGKYIDTIYIDSNGDYLCSKEISEYAESNDIESIINTIKSNAKDKKGYINSLTTKTGHIYYGAVKIDDVYYIGMSSGDYLTTDVFSLLTSIMIFFVLVFIIGAVIVIIWTTTLVKRINNLSLFISDMPNNNYKKIYVDNGDDEITELSNKVDDMRRRIIKDEETKESMLQNVSHDLKTPIAVIKSYAEAINDGVEDISSTNIIIEQCNKLEKKVKKLIQYNKLEYLNKEVELREIYIREIIEKIIGNCKYLSSIEIITDMDDSKLLCVSENMFIVCENIMENALRYAKSKIIITLKNNVLSFYNDGPHINEHFINYGFKPYEKGDLGNFGLGMSIVVKTLDHFNLMMVVENQEVGVLFIIKQK